LLVEAAQCAAGCAKNRLPSEASGDNRSLRRAEPAIARPVRAAQCAAGCAKNRLSSEASGDDRSEAESGAMRRRVREAPIVERSEPSRSKRSGGRRGHQRGWWRRAGAPYTGEPQLISARRRHPVLTS